MSRVTSAIHGGTLNINGVSSGGLVLAEVKAGYDTVLTPTYDGLLFGLPDRMIQYVRGSISSEDIESAINVLNGTLGTYTVYEKEWGLSTYTKHVITNPVIYALALNYVEAGLSTVQWLFECKAADGDKTCKDMCVSTATQEKPAYLGSDRATRITGVKHGEVAINHVKEVTVNMAGLLLKDSSDGDIGYTAVSAERWGITGSVRFLDAAVAESVQKNIDLLDDSVGDLEVTMLDFGGGGSAAHTIANVLFTEVSANKGGDGKIQEFTADFVVTDDTETPLTLSTAITIV